MTTPPAHTIDIAEFEAFCRGKPEGEAYDPYDASRCAMAQFLEAKYGDKVTPHNSHMYRVEGVGHVLAGPAYGPSVLLQGGLPTFTALADRLASLKTEDV